MNFDKYTIKSQEAIQKAVQIAQEMSNQVIEPAHLFKGIIDTDENVASFILSKLDVNSDHLHTKLMELIESYPKVSGGQQPYLSNDSSSALQHAEKFSKDLKDEYISIEHILLGILKGKDKMAQIMKDAGITEKNLKTAITELRKGNRVNDANA